MDKPGLFSLSLANHKDGEFLARRPAVDFTLSF